MSELGRLREVAEARGAITLTAQELIALLDHIAAAETSADYWETRAVAAEAKVARVEALADWWDTELADDETTYSSASDDLVAALRADQPADGPGGRGDAAGPGETP